MADKEISKRELAWNLFGILLGSARDENDDSPWALDDSQNLVFSPDFETLSRLLGVPLLLGANTQSGIPALALDTWLVYELTRAGFLDGEVWPRVNLPRVFPSSVRSLIESLSTEDRSVIEARLTSQPIRGATPSDARILGKNYSKQVDVVISDWATGPELLISTKRMDSSFGKNAPNRIEEAYGDAKNLRSRHPLAALGFCFGIRTTAFSSEPAAAEWLADLMQKLGREDDAYTAVCFLPIEYSDTHLVPVPADFNTRVLNGDVTPDELADLLPPVSIHEELVPGTLHASSFLTTLIEHILAQTPITYHANVRELRKSSLPGSLRGRLSNEIP